VSTRASHHDGREAQRELNAATDLARPAEGAADSSQQHMLKGQAESDAIRKAFFEAQPLSPNR